MSPIYIEVSAEVLYWEDATVNGQEDTNGTLIPLRNGNCWCPVIRLLDGMVLDWPVGTIADIQFKVCDAGEYWLLDENAQRIAKWGGFYVPDEFMCHGGEGYGDYIIMKIDADGVIKGWKSPAIKWVCSCDEDAQSGWKLLSNEGGAA